MGFKVKATWTLVGVIIGVVAGWIGCTRFYDVPGLRDKVLRVDSSTSQTAATLEAKMAAIEKSFEDFRTDLRELKRTAAKVGGPAALDQPTGK